MHQNEIFYFSICIYNHIFSCIIYMLLVDLFDLYALAWEGAWVYMGHNDTFVILDLQLSLFTPICPSSPLFFSLIKIIVSFSLSTKIKHISNVYGDVHKPKSNLNRHTNPVACPLRWGGARSTLFMIFAWFFLLNKLSKKNFCSLGLNLLSLFFW